MKYYEVAEITLNLNSKGVRNGRRGELVYGLGL